MTAPIILKPARLRSPLKWVGGKDKLAARILSFAPPGFTRYHERFLGGGAVYFALIASGWKGQAFLSDVNRGLIRTFRVVRDHPAELIAELKTHKTRVNHFYELRGAFNAVNEERSLDDVEAAAWFLFLNKTGFNGVYRENEQGKLNAPWGKPERKYVPDEAGIFAASVALHGATISCEPFDSDRAIFEGDFVYQDPPYCPVSVTAKFTAYTKGGFGLPEHIALRDLSLHQAIGAGARVVISNADVPAARSLYSEGFTLHEVQMRRAINSKASSRGKVSELLAVAGGMR